MRRSTRRVAALAAAALVISAAAAMPAGAATLPVYSVASTGFSTDQASALRQAFNFSKTPRRLDKSLFFFSSARYQAIPTKTVDPPPGTKADEESQTTKYEAIDFTKLNQLKTVPQRTARSKVLNALKQAGIGGLGTPTVRNTILQTFDAAGKPTGQKTIDTQVTFRRTLNGLPVLGPGQKGSVAFNTAGNVSRLQLATRSLRKGGEVQLLSDSEANQAAARQFKAESCVTDTALQGLKLSKRTVYYAPPLDIAGGARNVVPHFQYQAKALVDGQQIDLLGTFLPAVKSGAPKAAIETTVDGANVNAKSAITGGRPPYKYLWQSCQGSIPPEQATKSEINYTVAARDGKAGADDVLRLQVTDANGLVGFASKKIEVQEPAAAPSRASGELAKTSVSGVKDFGVWFIDASQGPDATGQAWDFQDEMTDVGTRRFYWGGTNFWRSDFVDPSKGGNDTNYVDNVDLTFVTAHGWPDGMVTGEPNGAGGYKSFTYNDVAWGNGDLEWMAALSCQTLKPKNSAGLGIDKRWLKGWKGLHMQLGFSTNAYNTSGFGNEFGDNIADDRMKIRQAWVNAAENYQPDGVVYATTGPIGANNVSNINDYVWNLGGSTGPDITSLTGWWVLYGTV